MSDNNSFLSNYGSGGDKNGTTPPKTYKYEQTSGFKKPARRESPPAGPGGGKTKLIVALSVGGAVVILLVILLVSLLGGGAELPDLTNWTLTDVQLWARENGVLIQTEPVYSDGFDADRIIAQDKEAETRVGKGDFVRVTVSLGHDLSVTLPLPDIMSMSVQQIEEWADANYMTKVRITSEFSATVAQGQVIRYEINDNTVIDGVRRDTPIYIIASKGPEGEAATVTVPDFKAISLAEAYAFASENGVTLTVREEYDAYAPAGTVMSQSAKKDEKISKGTEIVLVVSKGAMITVPDFKGKSKEQAAAMAAGLGIPATVVERYSSRSAGSFIGQSIEAGSVYESGDYLELTYALGKVIVPNFVGQTLDAIESWRQGVNAQEARIAVNTSESHGSAPRGTIIYQDQANKSVVPGASINITVSLGKLVFVPDLFGKTLEEAIVKCEEAGLVPVLVPVDQSDQTPGKVFAQSPGADELAIEGTKITVTFRPLVSP